MGPRAAKLTNLAFQPGFYTNNTPRDSKGRWVDGNRVRFSKGSPEKMRGWEAQTLTGDYNGVYQGVARAVHDWTSLDNQQWIAIGTHTKLFLVNNGKLFDITPLRKTSNLMDPLSTTLGSPLVKITDPDHRAEVGDTVTVSGATAVGGITLNGPYYIDSLAGVNAYYVRALSNATSTVGGGGSMTIDYDIRIGLPENGELLGYGTGPYGAGTYGTARPVGSGSPGIMRIWSLDNWGEDLMASPNDGALYLWDRVKGPNSRATLIPNAPDSIQRILVNPENRFLVALGCTTVDGSPDKMEVRWCSEENFNDWVASDTNSAGGKRLDYGSKIITGISTHGRIIVWTDLQLYGMDFIGAPLYFGFQPLGDCSIVGPNAAIDVNGVIFFWGFDDFFIYDGTLRVIPCDVWTHVFSNFDRTQAEKVYASTYRKKGEVRWDYEDEEGNGHYVIYNYVENCWYYGDMDRTAYHDISRSITGYLTNPYGLNNGTLYKHEFGTDEVEASSTNVMSWFMQSNDLSLGGSDTPFLITQLVPDYDLLEGDHIVTLTTRRFPNAADFETRGPYALNSDTERIDVRARGSQTSLLLESGTEEGQDFRMGIWQARAVPHGGR